jgi:hypothetical protein
MLETAVASAAVARADTIFFNAQLNPVVPEVGQWFCEYDALAEASRLQR